VTLEEAAAHIGAGVVYIPEHGAREDGVITSVTSRWVFVRYRGDAGSKATSPGDLTLLTTGVRS
jgi:hypothetical protein